MAGTNLSIIYLANIRLPTEKAHGLQIMKTCSALADQQVAVTLVIPGRKNNIKDDPFVFYGLKKNFNVVLLKVPDLVFMGRVGFWLSAWMFSERAAWYLRRHRGQVVWSRDHLVLLNLVLFGRKLIWEAHDGVWNNMIAVLMKRLAGLAVISNGLKDFYVQKGYAGKTILVPDAVEIRDFDVVMSKTEARIQLGFPPAKKIITYAGHLYSWKGVDVLAKAALELSDDFLVVFVGGTDKDLSAFKLKYQNIPNILITGRQPHPNIPMYLKASDVLVLPNSGKDDISRLYTSPMKLFEYMASRVPIVASRLPSIEEILTDQEAVLVIPDDAEALATGIEHIVSDPDLADGLADRAYRRVLVYSWFERARRIKVFLLGL